MAFGAAKDQDSSKRFMLIRVTPARHVSDDLALVSGLYQVTLPFSNMSKVTRNGVTLTEDSGTPTVNDHWQYSGTTKVLKIKLASAPDADTNVIVVFYHMFYTGEKYRYENESPDTAVSASNPVREWSPLIESYPSISQTARNITAGILSTATTSFKIINTDNSFQDYLTSEDSFSNKDVVIWLCIDDVSSIDKIYNGKIKGVSVDVGSISFSLFDPFVLLSQPATMGDTGNEIYFRRDADSFPDLDPDKHDRPCPYIIGSRSRAIMISTTDDLLTSTYTYGKSISKAISEANEAVCIEWDDDRTAFQANNEKWGCCRVPAAGLRTQTIGAITRGYLDGVAGVKNFYISGHDLKIGETINWLDGGLPRAEIVLANEDFVGNGGLTYNLITYGPASSLPSGTPFVPSTAPSVFVLPPGGTRLIPLQYSLQYTYNVTTLTSGRKFVYITLFRGVSYFEDDFWLVGTGQYLKVSDYGYLNPATWKIYYIVYPANEPTHADAISEILEAAGLTMNSAALTAAESALSANARFQIPQYDESEYKDYRSYAEAILKSVLGLIKINSSNEVVYEVLDAPSSTDTTDSTDYLNGSLSIDVDYNDITTELIGYNPHIEDIDDMDATSNTSTASASSAKAKYLHEITNTAKFRHVLDRIDNRIDAHIAVQSARKARYSFSTATKHLDTLIGDDMKLDSDSVLGGSGTVNLTVTKITKSGSETKIEAEDLEGL